ncbi:hypothetical protein Ddye_012129 [Dipteronia dyeriana]|uniref:Reverse transcriptase domain-containing protein n=1 Tax=Dipteronia dyeriana TaxID=168575 RepID=A0AAE0CIZ6_9ROSI|nr:hypothetical protein Ddye_012129 [Dipteronia dyeriana]
MGWYISSPSLSVLINGSPTLEFLIERGLRQGDPLSPFLFNIVAEALNCLFQTAVEKGLMKGTTIGNNSDQISHLQFTDDTILFLEPKLKFIRAAKRVLRCFELASKLKINFHKSCLVQDGKKNNLVNDATEIFRCKKACLPISYLGLPLGANPSSKAFWDPVLAQIEKRLHRGKGDSFLKGGGWLSLKRSYQIFRLTIYRFLGFLWVWLGRLKNCREIFSGLMG